MRLYLNSQAYNSDCFGVGNEIYKMYREISAYMQDRVYIERDQND